MSDYGITFAPTLDRPPETMVGETVYDAEGNAIGWIANATVGMGTCTIVKTWIDSDYADHWRYSCSECGYPIEVGERDVATGNPTSHANFCWNCGRRCIGIREATE